MICPVVGISCHNLHGSLDPKCPSPSTSCWSLSQLMSPLPTTLHGKHQDFGVATCTFSRKSCCHCSLCSSPSLTATRATNNSAGMGAKLLRISPERSLATKDKQCSGSRSHQNVTWPPYLVSPINGCPKCAIWHRIWCVPARCQNEPVGRGNCAIILSCFNQERLGK